MKNLYSIGLYDGVEQALRQRQLFKAINILDRFLHNVRATNMLNTLHEIRTSYEYLLQYMRQGTQDPQRDNIYHDIILRLYTFLDKVLEGANANNGNSLYYIKKDAIRKDAQKSLNSVLERLEAESHAQESSKSDTLMRETFDTLWTMSFDAEDFERKIVPIFHSQQYSLEYRQFMLSAIMLSTLSVYDERKIDLFFDEYLSEHHPYLTMQSFIALLFLSFRHSDRFSLSKHIQSRLAQLSEHNGYKEDLRQIFMMLLREQDTEHISRIMSDEFITEIIKKHPRTKSDLKDSDMMDILSDSDIEKRIIKMNELQREGNDTMMQTFARLKSFPFFSEMCNWFKPFSLNFIDATEFDGTCLQSIASADVLCDSDKYSLLLSIENVPKEQQEMLSSQLIRQQAQESENEENSLNPAQLIRYRFVRTYFFDLYRFYKLYPRKDEFYNVFDIEPFAQPSYFMNTIKEDKKLLSDCASFYFDREHFEQYLMVVNNVPTQDATILQRTGYCHQQLKQYHKAIADYLKADILKADNVWTLRHLAQCYRAVDDKEYALKFFRKALALKPENVSLLLATGHQQLDNGNVSEALKYFYKADFISGGSVKTFRPIAWCEFVAHNFEQSKNYYDKIGEANFSHTDHMNYGHLQLAQGDLESALKHYALSIQKGKFDDFLATFSRDRSALLQIGVTSDSISLVLDMLYAQLPPDASRRDEWIRC